MKPLKNCPCCGGSAKMAHHCCCNAVFVVCTSCSLSTANIYYKDRCSYPCFSTREEAERVAAARWNRRKKGVVL